MKRTLKILYLITILYGIASVSIDPLIPVISKELKIGYDRIGLILFLSFIFSLISILGTGKLSDKFNIKIIIFSGLFIIFLGFLLISLNYGIIIFIIALILQKSGYGSLDSSMRSYVAKVYHNAHTPIFIRIGIMFNIGTVISPLLVSLILFINVSYKYMFLLFTIAIAVLALILFKSLQKFNLDKIMLENHDKIENENLVVQTFKVKKFSAIIITSCIAMFFSMGSQSGASSWFTTYLSTFKIRVAISSIGLSLMWAFSLIGITILSKILKRTNEITILIGGGILGVLILLVAAFTNTVIVKIIFLLIHSACFASFFSLLTSIAVYESKKAKGSILGLIIGCAFSSSIIFQPILGYSAQYLGSGSVIFIIIAGYTISLISLIILFVFMRKKYKEMHLMFNFKV